MEILEMIMEWRKGCSCAPPEHPKECPECTLGLINAIEAKEKVAQYSGCITPKLHETIANLYGVVTRVPPKENNWLGSQVLVERDHVLQLMHEFFRLDKLLRTHFPNACPSIPQGDSNGLQA